MNKFFVRAVFDIDCDWSSESPTYRIFVNDELFVERSWRWRDLYLQENLQIEAAAGIYQVHVELLEPGSARLHVTNHQIQHGPARWLDGSRLQILG